MTNHELLQYVEELEVIKAKLENREAELQQQRQAALNIASDAKVSQQEADLAKQIAQEHSAVFQAVVDSSPTGLLGVNKAGKIGFVNETLVEMFGYDHDELIEKPVEVLVPPSLESEHREYLQSYLASPAARPMGAGRELQGYRKDGTRFSVEIGLRPVVGGSDLIAIAAVTNITERKRITDELHFRNEEMEQLLYTVSHDLESPLITIQGFSGMINEALAKNDVEDAQDSAERVAKATKSMEGLINDLLELSRVGRYEEKVEQIDVNVLLEQVKTSLESQFSECDAVLSVQETSLPTINTDVKRLYQIFQNLIENALKYGCELPGNTISVGYEESPSHHKFWVRDAGPGISKEYHNKIFLLFQRLKSKKDGTGLGLAIVMKAARSLGGRAWVESEPGHGATFWFSMAKRSTRERPPGAL
jgi:PAS domain S-box-containing protein